MTRARAALAGAAAALAWGLLEPIDQRIFRYRYSDVAILGKAVSSGRAWRPVGLAMHTANGAMFGLAWRALSLRRPLSPTAFALAEHVALFPLGALVDRIGSATTPVRIALVGKYVKLADAYKSVVEALSHGGYHHGADVEVALVNSEDPSPDELEAASVLPSAANDRVAA